jgi:hypothetical protein
VNGSSQAGLQAWTPHRVTYGVGPMRASSLVGLPADDDVIDAVPSWLGASAAVVER